MVRQDKKKLRIGWFSFTCSEDSTIIFTELLNDHYKDWNELFEFCHINILQKRKSINNLDIAFIEGAIAGEDEERKVKEIRKNAKKVVAIGACACIGMPSSQRNQFDQETNDEIRFLLDRFSHLDNVKSLREVIPVEYEVQGCPMNEEKFLETVDELLKEFGMA